MWCYLNSLEEIWNPLSESSCSGKPNKENKGCNLWMVTDENVEFNWITSDHLSEHQPQWEDSSSEGYSKIYVNSLPQSCRPRPRMNRCNWRGWSHRFTAPDLGVDVMIQFRQTDMTTGKGLYSGNDWVTLVFAMSLAWWLELPTSHTHCQEWFYFESCGRHISDFVGPSMSSVTQNVTENWVTSGCISELHCCGENDKYFLINEVSMLGWIDSGEWGRWVWWRQR